VAVGKAGADDPGSQETAGRGLEAREEGAAGYRLNFGFAKIRFVTPDANIMAPSGGPSVDGPLGRRIGLDSGLAEC
jgi:hypothetical protein